MGGHADADKAPKIAARQYALPGTGRVVVVRQSYPMPSLPTLPRRSWLERLSLGFALGLVAIGGLTLVGWWLRIHTLLLPFSNQTALTANEALGFLALGLALLALALGKRTLSSVAMVATIVGLLSLVQDVTHSDLHIDQLLVRDPGLGETESPGRMPAMVAGCLLLGGLVLVWRALGRGARTRPLVEAVAGTVVASAGWSTLLVYGAGLSVVYTWGTGTATTLVAAIALCVLGAALVLAAWRECVQTEGFPPHWAPMPAVILCLSMTVVLWIGLGEREQTFIAQVTQTRIEQFAIQIKGSLDRQASEIERLLARPWGNQNENNFLTWDADVRKQMRGTGAGDGGSAEIGCLSIAFVDLSLRTVWVYSLLGTDSSRGFDHASISERRTAIDQARESKGSVVSMSTQVQPPISTREKAKGFVIYSPIFRGGILVGFVAAEYSYRGFLSYIAKRLKLDSSYETSVSIGADNVFSLAAEDGTKRERLACEKTFLIADRKMRVRLAPSATQLRLNRRYLPELALFAGFGITTFLGLSVHLTRKALLRAAPGADQRGGSDSATRLIHGEPSRPNQSMPQSEPAKTPSPAASQRVFGGRYHLVRELGRGGMGVVWRAEDTKLNSTVALKLLQELVVRDREAMVDLAAETRRCLKLTHPHIVRVYDLVEEGDQAAISMEFVDGPSLADHKLAQPGRCFTPATLVPWIAQLCSALDYAHDKVRLVHRDLKPLNLLLNSSGDLKIVDFGISRSLGKAETRLSNRPRSSGFSLAYAGPQQLLGEPAAVTDDIYSLGVTVYELLTGKTPFFDGEIITQIREVVPPKMTDRRAALGVSDCADIPAEWEHTIAACLEKNAADRPQSAAEVAERLGVGLP